MLDNTLSKVVYVADGIQKQWDIPFEFYKIEDVHIYITSDGENIEEIDQNYYYDEEGKFFIYPTEESELDPIPAGTQVLILRETENTQLEDSSEIYFKSKDVERGLDNLTMQVQDLKRDSLRAVKLSHFSTQTPEDFAKGIFEAEKRATEAAANASLSEQNAASSKLSAEQASASAAANAELAQNAADGSLQNAERAEAAAATAVSTAETFRNKIIVIEASIDANADAIQRTRSDFMESDSELQQQINAHASELYTHRNDIDELGDQVAEIESKIPATASAYNQLADKQYVNDAIAAGGGGGGGGSIDVSNKVDKSGDTMEGPLNLPELNVQTDEGTLNLSITAGVATIATNNGLDIVSQTKFDTTPTTDDNTTWENALDTSLVRKAQVATAIFNEEMEIRADMNEMDSQLQTQINALADAIQGGGGGSAEIPDNVYTEDNLIAGENVTFDKKSGADDNTVGLFHFDGNAKDAVSGNELSESPVIATEGKFGTGSLKTRENWFNSVSFAKSIDPKTTSFTLEFWHKQEAGSVMGAYGDETTIVLAPTAPNNTASKSQWVGLYMLPDGSNNRISLQIGDSRLGQFNTGSYTTLGQWNHYALTWDASTHYFKLYMNGTYVDQYQYYYYDSLPILGGIGMFKYTDGNDGDTKAQMYIDELRFSDNVRYTGSFTVATEAFPSDKLKTIVNVNIPESGFNKDNLLGGKDIEIIPEPVDGGIDEHTVACWHFDEDYLDVVGGANWHLNYGSLSNAYYKFGSKSCLANGYGVTSMNISASGMSSWTIDGWVLFTSSSTKHQFGTGSYVNGYTSLGGLRAEIKSSQITLGKYRGTIDQTFTFDTALSLNTWHHLAVQLKDGKFQAFINGKKVAEIDWTEAVTSNFGFYQGGYLDEVRISDVARYNGDFTPPTQAYRVAVPTGRYLVNYTGESGAGKNIGEVYFSQSSLATDNAGALPLFTGETIASADTIYPDFYNWVTEHTELQATAEEYETAITNYGECPKYVLSSKVVTWTTGTYTIYSRQYPRYVSDFFSDKDCTRQLTPSDIGLSSYEEDGLKIIEKDGNTSIVLGNSSVIEESVVFLPNVDFVGSGDISSYYRSFTKTTEEDYLSGSLRLPKLANYIKMANTAEGITQSEAGLPNVTGSFTLTQGATILPEQVDGCFYREDDVVSATVYGGTATTTGATKMSASRSSEIYGNSDTVTPSHTTLYPWVFAYNASVPASTAQASEFQEGLSGKADTNLGNIPANYDYVVETYNDGTNWYRVYKSGWVEQGGYSTGATTKTITFLKPFATETPTITCTGRTGNIVVHTTELTSTTFKWHDSATPESVGVFWRAEGQGA